MNSSRSIFGLVITFLVLSTSCTQNGINHLNSFVEAHNSADIEGELSHLSDGFVYCTGSDTFRTVEDFSKLRGWDYGLSSKMSIIDLNVNDDTITFTINITNDWLTLIGFGNVTENGRAVFENDLIKEFIIEENENTSQRYNEITEPFGQWVDAERKEQLEQIKSKGMISKETTSLWIDLWNEWKAQEKSIESK